MPDLDTLISQAKLPERTVPLCLRGDLQAQFEDLERELRAEQGKGVDSLAGNPRVREIAEQIEALREEMLEATVVLRVTGVPRKEWNAMVAAHEPREDNDVDAGWGYNTETFFPALIKACLGKTVTDDQWDRLQQVLSSGQFDELTNAAVAVSRRQVDIPKSLAASAALQRFAETSS